MKICTSYEYYCVDNVMATVSDERSQSFKSCDCLPDCDLIAYHHNLIRQKITVENSSNFINASSGLVNFDSDEYLAYKRYPSHGTVSLLSNIGGVLGLFLGISVLSIIEMIYFFTLRFIANLWVEKTL
jgi:acid-sensing ion channel, other